MIKILTRQWRKLHNEEFNDLHSSSNIMRGINSRRMRWVGHVARMEKGKCAYKVLVEKPEGKEANGEILAYMGG